MYSERWSEREEGERKTPTGSPYLSSSLLFSFTQIVPPSTQTQLSLGRDTSFMVRKQRDISIRGKYLNLAGNKPGANRPATAATEKNEKQKKIMRLPRSNQQDGRKQPSSFPTSFIVFLLIYCAAGELRFNLFFYFRGTFGRCAISGTRSRVSHMLFR